MAEIKTIKGTVLVDDDVLNILNKYGLKVSIGNTGYPEVTGTLHHLVVGKPSPGLHIDHINRKKFDARRSNLRLCTPRQNNANTGPRKGQRFKGVSIKHYKRRNGLPYSIGYRAKIAVNGKDFVVGIFSSEEEAAYNYDLAAKIVQGEYAYLNFPDGNSKFNYALSESIVEILKYESDNYTGVPTIEPGIYLRPHGKFHATCNSKGKKLGKIFESLEQARIWRESHMALGVQHSP